MDTGRTSGNITMRHEAARARLWSAQPRRRLIERLLPVTQVMVACVQVQDDDLSVVMVSAKSGSGWTFPKGTIEAGETVAEAALREAYEEAGVKGRILNPFIGDFTYRKGSEFWPRRAALILVEVDELVADYPEVQIRKRRTFKDVSAAPKLSSAVHAAREAGLLDLVQQALSQTLSLKA